MNKINKFRKNTAAMLIILLLLAACSKKNEPTPEFKESNLAQLSVEFDNIVGERTLTLNNTGSPYRNAAGEPFTISRLQYFISNIAVTTAAGNTYIVNPDSSYFLINGADRSTRFTKIMVPEGDYTSLRFTIGVDSLRSTMPVDKRTGILDPAAGGSMEDGGMYWGWNSGYIFFKMEGKSDVVSNDVNGDPTGNKQFKYHIGFFGGYSAPTLNNIEVINVDLKTAGVAKVRKDRQSNIHLFVDVMKVFNGRTPFKISENPNVMFSDFSATIARNYTEMFTHDHTEN